MTLAELRKDSSHGLCNSSFHCSEQSGLFRASGLLLKQGRPLKEVQLERLGKGYLFKINYLYLGKMAPYLIDITPAWSLEHRDESSSWKETGHLPLAKCSPAFWSTGQQR